MRRRRPNEPSFLRSPVLIGALTVLVVIVAVALAYNANTGLPFVPSYYLHVQMRDASELQKGDNVNEGGSLIGLVSGISATRNHTGKPVADVTLKLYKNVEPLPADTRFTVRLKGAIGLKYLDVSPGRSRQGLKNGATVPVSQTGTSTDFDQVLNMFTPPTRKGVQQSTIGFGEAVAGRGYDLNQAIGKFLPLARTCSRSRPTWPRRAPISPASSGGWSSSPGRSRRSPRRRRRCSPISTPPSRRSPRWRRHCRTRSRRRRRRSSR